MHWAFPGAFLLLLLLPIIAASALRRRRDASVLYSALSLTERVGSSWRDSLRPLLIVLRLACLVLLIIALARPQQVRSEVRIETPGIAIMIVLDRSSSMAEHMTFDGSLVSRYEVAKQVLAEFVLGNGADLPGRAGDLIGLIGFARYADTICPLVRAHDALVGFAMQTDIVQFRDEDGTAIGDALALAVARLASLEDDNDAPAVAPLAAGDAEESDEPAFEQDAKVKSKIIVLLTDGEHNAGLRTPAEAAELARHFGIRIYSVGISGSRPAEPRGLFDMRLPFRDDIDERMLRAIAERTGGAFWRAEDGDSLRRIYQTIDALEKSEIEATQYMQRDEAFMAFARAALILLLAEIALRSTILRRSP